MAVLNEAFYRGEDLYSDGSIEDEILAFVRSEKYPDQTDEWIGNDFVRAYHLSVLRENILNWYPFSGEETALEIGAGCGALSGMLSSRLKKVTALDLSKKRSMINYERNRDRENLEIMVGNLEDIRLTEAFDYVIVNGVLEYAMSFIDSDTPYTDFLKICRSFLKPEGKLLLAIENKMGMKYLNGSMEDHTDSYYLGINGYPQNDTVRTFTESELKGLLVQAGFFHTNMYYPYPDYKFPSEIFSKEGIDPYHYGKPYLNIERGKLFLFDEQSFGQMLGKEGIREKFANSFLVEAGQEFVSQKLVYAKLNTERKNEFCIGTTILYGDDGKYVRKFPLNEKAVSHIEGIIRNCRKRHKEKISYLSVTPDRDGLKMPFLTEKNLASLISEYIEQKDVQAVKDLISRFFEILLGEQEEVLKTDRFYSDLFLKWFGEAKTEKEYLCIREANIDVIMENIFGSQNYQIIDPEWFFDDWIPYSFIIWRALNELFEKERTLENLISRRDMMASYAITEADEDLFRKWANHFADDYVGSKRRSAISLPVFPASLHKVYEEERKYQRVEMSLYFEENGSYSEECKVFRTVDLKENEFCVSFPIGGRKKTGHFRFDPVEGSCSGIQILLISEGFEVTGNNADELRNNMQLFFHTDPIYEISYPENPDEVFEEGAVCTIKGTLNCFNREELLQTVQKQREKTYEITSRLNQKIVKEEERASVKRAMEQELTCSLYVDYGYGFSEENRLQSCAQVVDGCFLAEFRIPKPHKVVRLRFDFLEGYFSSCIIYRLSTGFFICGSNASVIRDGMQMFLTKDPYYFLKSDRTRELLRIEGKVIRLNQNRYHEDYHMDEC